MSFISRASGASRWRGYEYWEDKKVLSVNRVSETETEGVVTGAAEYHVKIDAAHPSRSTCDCPFAHGRRVICKHMVALYFAVYPQAAEEYRAEVEQEQEEWENEREETKRQLIEFVGKMKKDELRDALLQLLFDGPDWQYEDFVSEYLE